MTILQKAENFIFQLHKDTLSEQHSYHNFNHTLRVVNALKELIPAENISLKNAEILLLAGWFHDSGHSQVYEGHEEISGQIAYDFLNKEGYQPQDIKLVVETIIATKLNHEPQNILEASLKDADFSHFADSNYYEISLLLKDEINFFFKMKLSELQWNIRNKQVMLNEHRYYTDYAKKTWHPKKEKNLLKVIERIQKLEEADNTVSKKELKKKRIEKLDRPDRGIDTLFRVTLKNHTQLSAIADSKANILLSVNAIIISICLSALIPKLDSPSNAHLIYPTFVLLLSSVASIIFAILSTRPKITTGTFTKDDIEHKKVNLLFFGNFHKMPLQDYTDAINEVMKDRDYLYDSLIKDLYSLGLVLNRKYRLLRITYSIFMIGIIISVLSFIIAFRGIGF